MQKRFYRRASIAGCGNDREVGGDDPPCHARHARVTPQRDEVGSSPPVSSPRPLLFPSLAFSHELASLARVV